MTETEINALADALVDKIAQYHKEVLTFDEAARYTGLAKSYLYKLTANKMIPHSKPTGRLCFFERVELDKWMLENPVKTNNKQPNAESKRPE